MCGSCLLPTSAEKFFCFGNFWRKFLAEEKRDSNDEFQQSLSVGERRNASRELGFSSSNQMRITVRHARSAGPAHAVHSARP